MRANPQHGDPMTGPREWGLAVLRIVVGFTFLMHGWQKVFEMGLPGVAGFFGQLGVPAPTMAATVVAFLELAGGAALLAGLFSRWVAMLLAVDVLVAILLVHLPNGFFGPMGYELTLLLLGSTVALALAGPGAPALDRVITRRAAGGLPRGRAMAAAFATDRD